ERDVEVEVSQESFPHMDMFGPNEGNQGPDINIMDMLREVLPKKKKRRTVHVHEARRLLVDEELRKLVDMDDVVTEALDRVENHGMIFIDEIDKIAGERGQAGPDVSREGVQRDLLPIVEGSTVQTRYGLVRTDHVLFIAAGAFHVSKPSDLIPELQGRFPIRVELTALSEEDLVRILREPKSALLTQYQALLGTEGVSLEFTDEAIREMARFAMEVNRAAENIGARRLATILETVLEELSFEASELGSRAVEIGADEVRRKLAPLVQNQDLSRFIL